MSSSSMDDKKKQDDLEWEIVHVEHLAQDCWMDLRKVAYKLPDGKVFEPFYTYSRRDFVIIVARDTMGRYICVKQFRPGLNEVTTEFVAGGLEAVGDKKFMAGDPEITYEDPLDAAKRELLEETGYQSKEWKFVFKVPSNATLSDNYAYIYFADHCEKVSVQELDDTEFLNVELYTEEELRKLIYSGGFQQGPHIMAWYMIKDEFLAK